MGIRDNEIKGFMCNYTNFIMEILSKDNDKLKKENQRLKTMIMKFISGEYTKKELNNKF